MMRCESGWTGDRCQLNLGHNGPHDNEINPDEHGLVEEHRAGLHEDAYMVECFICRRQEADFDEYRERATDDL